MTVDEGIAIECGYDRITISFSNPADFRNIRSIWLAWRTAGKYVQSWIKESVSDKRKTDKVDTPVTFDTQEKCSEAIHSSLHDKDDILFDSGCFNEIALGYLTLTLQAMGMQSGTVLAAQKAMNSIFDKYNSVAARKAYKES